MKTTITNKFHGFTKTINHRGNLPSVSALEKAFRAAKPSDCISDTIAVREDGVKIVLENFGQGKEVMAIE
jgi:hypothetical protein